MINKSLFPQIRDDVNDDLEYLQKMINGHVDAIDFAMMNCEYDKDGFAHLSTRRSDFGHVTFVLTGEGNISVNAKWKNILVVDEYASLEDMMNNHTIFEVLAYVGHFEYPSKSEIVYLN